MVMESWDTNSRIAVLESEIKAIGREIGQMRQEQAAQMNQMREAQSKMQSALVEKLDHMEKRIQVVERWRWMLIGAAAVGGYFLAHFRLEKFL